MTLTAAVLAVALLAAGAARADPPPTGNYARDKGRTVCLDLLGDLRPPVCRSQSASRLDTDPDICFCGGGLLEASAPYCAVGEKPAPESAAAGRARRLAAERGRGRLEGGFEGRRFCVERGRTGG